MNPNIHIHNKHTPPPSTPPAPSTPLPGPPPQLPPATLTPSSNTTSTVLRAPSHTTSHIQPSVDFQDSRSPYESLQGITLCIRVCI